VARRLSWRAPDSKCTPFLRRERWLTILARQNVPLHPVLMARRIALVGLMSLLRWRRSGLSPALSGHAEGRPLGMIAAYFFEFVRTITCTAPVDGTGPSSFHLHITEWRRARRPRTCVGPDPPRAGSAGLCSESKAVVIGDAARTVSTPLVRPDRSPRQPRSRDPDSVFHRRPRRGIHRPDRAREGHLRVARRVARACDQYPAAHLLIVGLEAVDPVPEATQPRWLLTPGFICRAPTGTPRRCTWRWTCFVCPVTGGLSERPARGRGHGASRCRVPRARRHRYG
jgi:hypothetical protein